MVKNSYGWFYTSVALTCILLLSLVLLTGVLLYWLLTYNKATRALEELRLVDAYGQGGKGRNTLTKEDWTEDLWGNSSCLFSIFLFACSIYASILTFIFIAVLHSPLHILAYPLIFSCWIFFLNWLKLCSEIEWFSYHNSKQRNE